MLAAALPSSLFRCEFEIFAIVGVNLDGRGTIRRSRGSLTGLTQLIPAATIKAVIISPTNRSYWVVPGEFAAGAYPGTHRYTTGDRIEAVEQLLSAGIGDFVNLTQDRWGGTDEHLVHYDEAVGRRASVSRFEIPDLGIPTVEEMKVLLDHIDQKLAEGLGVYVHCWGGIGRTGTVVGCWLLRHRHASSKDVLSLIAKRRKGDQVAGDRTSPETEQQREFVRAWRVGS